MKSLSSASDGNTPTYISRMDNLLRQILKKAITAFGEVKETWIAGSSKLGDSDWMGTKHFSCRLGVGCDQVGGFHVESHEVSDDRH